jgi:hypothetical protein
MHSKAFSQRWEAQSVSSDTGLTVHPEKLTLIYARLGTTLLNALLNSVLLFVPSFVGHLT